MNRTVRKIDHLEHALAVGQERAHGFNDVQFVHQSMPNCSVDEIQLSTKIGELDLSSPIFINAMTGGGGERTKEINGQLAQVAAKCNIGIAVGSQMSAIKDHTQRETYEIVRKMNPNGLVLANLGSEATVEQAKQAVDMLEANGLQIHLNVIQELVMPEGDRDFTDALKRIEQIVTALSVPVIVKEVGFGMSKETAQQLANAGVTIMDVGGFGGTNFSKVENCRRETPLSFFDDWGIKTTCSIVEVKSNQPFASVIGSGGIQTSLDIAKSIALGASAVGLAGYILKVLTDKGSDGVLAVLDELHKDLKLIMTALGVTTIPQLQKVPLVISGDTYHWLEQRGFNTKIFGMRGQKK
ncbi:type 2 isopentenyl-diphosphate Delta-isomerase [Anaerobacillus sp. MEB173]|uniref:type 2 isopentenyl-diphosphate Delta-isomerase n=1 Tax=Anaerobacillus sp. MEB173 TaxID=3383345 RepID=UPI003F9342AB